MGFAYIVPMFARSGCILLAAAALLQAHAEGPACKEFPFQFRDGLVWVEAPVPGKTERLNFLLDSGAGVSVLNIPTLEHLGLERGKRVVVQGVGALVEGYWPQHLSLSVGNVALPKNYLAVDLTELSGACESRVDGLIGADFFKGQVVQIDFRASKIKLLDSSEGAGQENIPLKYRRAALLVPARINHGKRQWLRLDTGCSSELQWVTGQQVAQVESHRVAVALAKISIPVAATTLELGSMRFESVPTGLHHQAIFSGENGLLGNGILAKFNSITIDAKAGRLVLGD